VTRLSTADRNKAAQIDQIESRTPPRSIMEKARRFDLLEAKFRWLYQQHETLVEIVRRLRRTARKPRKAQ
jgi:hypothetical protein